MSELFANIMLRKADGGETIGSVALSGKVVGIFFGASWCAPCQVFTPLLRDFYDKIKDHGFEVVFVSWDETECQQEQFVRECHGDWYYVPFSESALMEELKDRYGITGVPKLVIIKPDGEVADKEGRADVHRKTAKESLKEWKQLMKSAPEQSSAAAV